MARGTIFSLNVLGGRTPDLVYRFTGMPDASNPAGRAAIRTSWALAAVKTVGCTYASTQQRGILRILLSFLTWRRLPELTMCKIPSAEEAVMMACTLLRR